MYIYRKDIGLCLTYIGLNLPLPIPFLIQDYQTKPLLPSTVRGGLTLREGINMMETIYATGRLRAVDLVEINPAIGTDTDRRHTIDAGLSILKAALGAPRRGTAPKGVLDLPKPTTA